MNSSFYAVTPVTVKERLFGLFPTRVELTMTLDSGSRPVMVHVEGSSAKRVWEALPRIGKIIKDEKTAAQLATQYDRRAANFQALADIGRHHVASRGVSFDVMTPKR